MPALLAALWASAAADDAGASCKTRIVRDYTGFLAALPPLPSAPINERLPFAPERVFFSSPWGGQLQAGAGPRYYRLSYSPADAQPSPKLDWHLTATLTPIDESGQALAAPQATEQQVDRLPSERSGAEALRVGFDVPSDPAVYRLELEIKDGNGEQLARFGEYFRVLEPRIDLRPSLNRSVFRPGQRLRATLANYGVAWYGYGYPWGVEYKRGNSWKRSPVDFTPRAFFMPLFSLKPGESTSCWSGVVPRDAPPGRYRFRTSIFGPEFAGVRRRMSRQILLGFTVLPRKSFAANTAVGRRTSRPAA